MPTVCLVRECSTRYGKTNDIRFHKLPDDPQRRSAWLRAIDRDGPDDIGRSQGYLCSHHFLAGDYDMNIEVRRSLGLDTKRARLRPDAVPTQHLWFDAPPKKRRSEDLNGSPDVVDMIVEEGPIPRRTVDGWTQTTRNAVTALCQTGGGDVQTQFTQASF
uniref:Putative the thap domain is a dna-binding domainthe thap domain is a dna-binding domain protein n=2 Tax=Ixodes ricinus TaxID=34613 RepID=A0A147BCR0_IXORI